MPGWITILFVGQYGDDSVDAQREGRLGNSTQIGGKFQSSEAGISINQLSGKKKKKTNNNNERDLPGGPVSKTSQSQHRGPGFHPWLGN